MWLCGEGKHHPLPKDILGDDLLKYWLDNQKYDPLRYLFMSDKGTTSKLYIVATVVFLSQLPNQKYNPLQYLFTSDKGTTSKLHRGNGGLLISIAPIISIILGSTCS
jgi:hypothetical protein